MNPTSDFCSYIRDSVEQATCLLSISDRFWWGKGSVSGSPDVVVCSCSPSASTFQVLFSTHCVAKNLEYSRKVIHFNGVHFSISKRSFLQQGSTRHSQTIKRLSDSLVTSRGAGLEVKRCKIFAGTVVSLNILP